MDGTMQEVRELLDRAVEAERRELFPDPDDMARLKEAELDALPEDTAGAVRALKEYDWRSAEARQAYEQIQDRSEEHTSELQSRQYLVCRLLLEKKKKTNTYHVSSMYIQFHYYQKL